MIIEKSYTGRGRRMSFKLGVLAGLGASLSVAMTSPAFAQDNRIISNFSRADVISALTKIGATYDESSGDRSINIVFQNGMKANVLLLACESEEPEVDCRGASILANFRRPRGASDMQVQAAINEYNYSENFGRAYVDPDGVISVRLYVISDGGISFENFYRNMSLWERSLGDFTGYLYPSETKSKN